MKKSVPCSFSNLKNKDGFQDIDFQFAKFILKEANTEDEILFLSAALASYSLRAGNTCCSIKHLAETKFPEYKSGIELGTGSMPTIILPEYSVWKKCLSKYPHIVSSENYTPLILDNSDRLYLHRYWNYENKLAAEIRNRCQRDIELTDKITAEHIKNISTLFQNYKSNNTDWQQVAVLTAILNKFCIITGGPGTGKTTTVTAILAMLLDINPNYKIKICAPTGKAGSRLNESISEEINNINPLNSLLTTEKLRNLETSTVHRLLKPLPMSPHFKHNEKNPILADIVVVDEASMIPQALFFKLISAIPKSAKIILLGDKDQLASVEAGAVMASLCNSTTPNEFSEKHCSFLEKFFKDNKWKFKTAGKTTPLINSVIELEKSYRFDDDKGIGKVKHALHSTPENIYNVGKNNSEEFILLHLPKVSELEKSICSYIDNLYIADKSAKVHAASKKIKFTDFMNAETPEKAFYILSEFKILCSHNIGLTGVDKINRIIHSHLFKEPFENLPVGTPIMIIENNNQLQLFNGDMGIIWNDESGYKKAFFPNGHEDNLKPVSLSLLPKYTEVFAMTIHKSQGSGFQKILVILPGSYSPILTKELIYTAITRAKKECVIWAKRKIFEQAAVTPTIRHSGLEDKLLRSGRK